MTIYNFTAGPAVLPMDVLARVKNELTDFKGTGVSVMETSHRSAEFVATAAKAEADLRKLLQIPEHYRVLFVQGGASAQFAAVPLNLTLADQSADYICTGYWSKKAMAEADRYLKVDLAASSENDSFTSIPVAEKWHLNTHAQYVHYTPNETIGGVEFHVIPDVGDKPLVADMSSTILSRPMDVSRFGVIYAGAQKNIGPAGITIVIVRDDLLERARPDTPSMMSYRQAAESDSMLNTPPVFAWYMAGLVFEWLLDNGGLAAQEKRNIAKAKILYDAIDNSIGYYTNPVSENCRSRMNVPFTIHDEELTAQFLSEAGDAGLMGLKGHRSVGGMRASIYNAMSAEGVRALVQFMTDFQRKNG